MQMSEKKPAIGRRELLQLGAKGMTCLGIMGFAGSQGCTSGIKTNRLLSSSKLKTKIKTDNHTVIQRTLGKTGILLPIVSMGVMNADNPALVTRAFEKGIRHFDTAAYYQQGNNEIMLGGVLSQMGARSQAIIGTKVYIPKQQRPYMSPAEIKSYFLQTLDQSLHRLQSDYVDILYAHNVSTLEFLNNPGLIEALQDMKERKKALHVGFSTHTNMTQCILDATQTGRFDVIQTAFNYAMVSDDEYIQSMIRAADAGIGLVAMKTQCQQPWYKEGLAAKQQQYYEGEINHTALLKWVLQHDFITTAIPGFTTFDEIELDWTVTQEIQYAPEEHRFLRDRKVIAALRSACLQCESCKPTCPKGVDVPSLVRSHMYAFSYHNLLQAAQTLNETQNLKKLSDCTACPKCVARCKRNVDISTRIHQLKSVFA